MDLTDGSIVFPFKKGYERKTSMSAGSLSKEFQDDSFKSFTEEVFMLKPFADFGLRKLAKLQKHQHSHQGERFIA